MTLETRKFKSYNFALRSENTFWAINGEEDLLCAQTFVITKLDYTHVQDM